MPVIDLFSDAQLHPIPECDICIIGSEATGSTSAAELSGETARVVMLESGSFKRGADRDDLNEIENTGRVRSDQWPVRNTIVGGSSLTWCGRCPGFDEIDFESRPWVLGSGWSIAQQELKPYRDRSAAHFGLATGTGFSCSSFWQMACHGDAKAVPDPAKRLRFFWQQIRDPQESYPYSIDASGGISAKDWGRM